jgi:hypothetical protein
VKHLLLETWELWRQALFCPSRLKLRFGALGRDETSSEGVRFLDVLWFRTRDKPASRRLIREFAFLTSVAALPLVFAILALGRPRDLVLVGAALLSAFGIGAFCLPLGLLVPFIFAVIYLSQPSGPAAQIDHVVAKLSLLQRDLGLGLGVGMGGLMATGLSTDVLWRRNLVVHGRVTLALGTLFSVLGANWITSHNISDLAPVGGLTLLGVGLAHLEEGWRGKNAVALGVIIAGVTAFVLFFSCLISDDSLGIQSPISGTPIVICFIFIFLTVVGLIPMGTARACSNSATAVILGGIFGGILVGCLMPLAVGTFAGFVTVHRLPMLILYWALGFSLAPGHWAFWFLLAVILPISLRFQNGGMASALVAAMLGYSRTFPDYVVLGSFSLARAAFLGSATREAPARWLRKMPPYEGELVWLPLPGHTKILVAAFRAIPEIALEALQRLTRADDFFSNTREKARSQIESAAVELPGGERRRLVIHRLGDVEDLGPLVSVATDSDFWLRILVPPSGVAPENQAPEDIHHLLPRLRAIAHDVGMALQQQPASKLELGLERCLDMLTDLRDALPHMGFDHKALPSWQTLIEHWRALIEKELGATPTTEIDQIFQCDGPILPARFELLKGRDKLAADVARQVAEPGRPSIVLHGPRRVGKSSFLVNLGRLLPDVVLPVYLDVQSGALTASEGDFCYGIARAAARDVKRCKIEVPVPTREAFRENPYPVLEDWLDALQPLLGERRLLLCVDEFEKIGEVIARGEGKFSLALFDEIRHLIQHREELAFIFCGAQTLDELGPQYASYFINTRPIEVGNLEEDGARDLLLDPGPDFTLRYQDDIVERVIHLTSCQPYLLQLLGAEMIKVANRHKVRKIDETLLEEAIHGSLTSGEFYFTDLWNTTTGTTPEEVAAGREHLRALANGRAVVLGGEASSTALKKLLRYRVVMESREGYRVCVPLVARWVLERGERG